MKRTFFVSILLFVISLLPTLVFAEANGITTASIPFSFYVGNKLMPAGNYIARADENKRLLYIKSTDSGDTSVIGDMPSDTAQALMPGMRFDQIGGTYFLRAVSDSNQEFDLAQTKLEKSLARAHFIAQTSVPAHGF